MKKDYGSRSCENCSNTFEKNSGSQRFCSKICFRPLKLKHRLKDYYKNKDKYLANNKRWREANPERMKELARIWKENNRKLVSFLQRQREARKVGRGTHSLAEWENLKKKCSYTCLMCKREEPEIKLTEDHIVPLIVGGSNTIENIQPLCGVCNSKKGRKTINCLKKYYI